MKVFPDIEFELNFYVTDQRNNNQTDLFIASIIEGDVKVSIHFSLSGDK